MIRSWLRSRASNFVVTGVFESELYVNLKTSINYLSGYAIDFSREPQTVADLRVLRVVELLQPVAMASTELIRVGGDRDGGYIMFSEITASAALSIGIGPDVTWDIDLARRGLRVEMFDPTITDLPEPVPGGRFHRLGIAGGDGQSSPEFKSLDHLLATGDLDGDDDLILKLDVEGAEWGAFSSVEEPQLRRFQQIACELHDLSQLVDDAACVRVLAVIEVLTASHAVVHITANNHGDCFSSGAYVFPNILEVTFVRRDLLGDRASASTTHCELARPNDPRVPAIDLDGILLQRRG